jgi:hypothetical protein
MYTRTREYLLAGGILFAVASAPIAASAQQTLAPVHVTESVAIADRLSAEADSLARQLTTFKKAAALYEKSAAARSPGDLKAVANLRSAAMLRYDGGDARRSLALMERAAERAVGLGDVISAANAYIDAAIIASELREGAQAKDFSRRAALLTKSPLLDGGQRTALLVRMNGWNAVMEVAMR